MVNTDRNSVVGIVEDDLYEGGDDARAGAFMQQCLALFFTHVTELIGQHKLDCCQQTTRDR